MTTVRNLLSRGNGKLGPNIFHWSIPAVSSCPGKTSVCQGVCYANNRGRFAMTKHKERLRENYEACFEPDFATRMVQEVKRRWVQVLRVHVAGDFFAKEYTEKWIDIAKACRKVRFYAYTRSWRVAAIEPALRELAGLRNVRLWYSADREAQPGLPLPLRVRVAYLQDEDVQPLEADLVFRVRRLRKHPSRAVGLPLVCPSDTHTGKAKGVDCGSCGRCWK